MAENEEHSMGAKACVASGFPTGLTSVSPSVCPSLQTLTVHYSLSHWSTE